MAEALGVGFESPTGERLDFEWWAEAFERLGAASPPDQPVWTLAGELDWDEVDSVRVLSARLGDGRLLAVAALRPAGAEGHGEDLVAGAIGDGDSFSGLDQPLLSVEYDGAGTPQRIGLEVHPIDDGPVLRIAADVTATADGTGGGVSRVAAVLAVRGPEGAGAGAFDLLSRA
jgi:hypothetical protein